VKRFLLFAWYSHRPEGGWGDFKGSYDTTMEASKDYYIYHQQIIQVIDSQTNEVVRYIPPDDELI
jgi:hypothetical protein